MRQRLDIPLSAFVLEDDVAAGRTAEFAQSIDELANERIRGRIEARGEHTEDPDAHGMAGRRCGRERGPQYEARERNGCEHQYSFHI